MKDTKDILEESSHNYERIEQAIIYLEENYKKQPGLDEIAASVHLSKYHFQRLFKDWAGVTPTQFMRYLTVEYAKQQLRQSRSIFETTLKAGLSSGGRLHDLFISFEAMTPGEYKNQGNRLDILYGVHPSPFGVCLAAITERGICGLRFSTGTDIDQQLRILKNEWPLSNFQADHSRTRPIVERIFSESGMIDGKQTKLLLRGTNFQVQVWKALLAIPPGGMIAYQDIASGISKPSAARAAAGAVARNPVAYLIPCHRVIRKSGRMHRYRWGSARKKAILGWEAGHNTPEA